jgi:L-ascorbate metabolism protein UlaG (beta-lactamase superfamily)
MFSLWRFLGAVIVALVLAAFLLVPRTHLWKALGARPAGERLARMERSPNWAGGRFQDFQPIRDDTFAALTTMFHASPDATPKEPVPVVHPTPESFAIAPSSGLRVTWFGHSTTLVEIDGVRLLTDPEWSERASPLGSIGPKRYYPVPIALHDLPPIDAVLISHDHYDHLDYDTIVALKDSKAVFVVPLGVGADLELWGIPADRIRELDWWEHAHVATLDIVSTPARHATGRMIFDRDTKLWTGYALLGGRNRVYYSGDSGFFPALGEIGDRFGPFDLAMIEIGQYNRAWRDWHMGPEQAVRAVTKVRGRVFLPIHWGALTLAPHGWTEPIERAVVAAQTSGLTIVTPRPGESVEPSLRPPVERWWPALPWNTAEEDPIVSTQVE